MNEIPLQGYNLPLDLVNTKFVRYNKYVDCLSTVEAYTSWIKKELGKYFAEDDKVFQELLENKIGIENTYQEVLVLREQLVNYFENFIKTKDTKTLLTFCKNYLRDKTFIIHLTNENLQFIPAKKDKTFFTTMIIHELLIMIEDGRINYLKNCANEACVLFFIDKTGRRKWCSMKTCGNRMKSKNQYHKHK